MKVNFVRSLFFVQRNLIFPNFLWRERDIENTNRRRVCVPFVRQWTLSWCLTGWTSSRNVCVSRFVRPRSQRRIINILTVWWHHLLHGCCSTAKRLSAITFHNSRPLIVLYIFISSQYKQANYVISARIFHRVLFNIFMRGIRRHPTKYNEKFIGVLLLLLMLQRSEHEKCEWKFALAEKKKPFIGFYFPNEPKIIYAKSISKLIVSSTDEVARRNNQDKLISSFWNVFRGVISYNFVQ